VGSSGGRTGGPGCAGPTGQREGEGWTVADVLADGMWARGQRFLRREWNPIRYLTCGASLRFWQVINLGTENAVYQADAWAQAPTVRVRPSESGIKQAGRARKSWIDLCQSLPKTCNVARWALAKPKRIQRFEEHHPTPRHVRSRYFVRRVICLPTRSARASSSIHVMLVCSPFFHFYDYEQVNLVRADRNLTILRPKTHA
jgi:hypothetical protein